mmetsp:Transcript_22443/g.48314  ORF Transcript_22443/g.48314 Transcript_22443/m.48314 type:complete len:215 (-) Transcript_22443:313-957(-)
MDGNKLWKRIAPSEQPYTTTDSVRGTAAEVGAYCILPPSFPPPTARCPSRQQRTSNADEGEGSSSERSKRSSNRSITSARENCNPRHVPCPIPPSTSFQSDSALRTTSPPSAAAPSDAASKFDGEPSRRRVCQNSASRSKNEMDWRGPSDASVSGWFVSLELLDFDCRKRLIRGGNFSIGSAARTLFPSRRDGSRLSGAFLKPPSRPYCRTTRC